MKFIHSDHFYSASSSPLLLRRAPDIARTLCRSFTPKRHGQLQVTELAQGSYVAARAGVEPTTLGLKGIDPTKAPPRQRNATIRDDRMQRNTRR